MPKTSKIVKTKNVLFTSQGVAFRNWLIASLALLALIAIMVLNAVAAGNGNGTSNAGASSTGSSTPAGAKVLEVGAVAGPNGSALLNVRDASLTSLNVQFLEFGDEDSVPTALAAGTGSAAIIPVTSKIPRGHEVIAKLYNVESGGTEGVQVLIAPQDSPLKPELQTLAQALQSKETLDYLNSLSGIKVSKLQ